MPVPSSRLSVYPNPYIVDTIDHLGRPAGRVPFDPYEDSPRAAPAAGVGAVFAEVKQTHAEQTLRFGKQAVQLSAARHDHRIAYERGPVEIPNTGYYRDAIRSGALFAGNVKTFVAAGGAAGNFVEPAQALEAAKALAIERFNASTGEDAHADMGAFEPLWIGDDAPSEPSSTGGGEQPKPESQIKPFQPTPITMAPAVSTPPNPKLTFGPPSKTAEDAKGDLK